MKNNIGNYRWRIVALLFFSTTINYLDRQVLGILKPYISGDLGWSEADYGYIVSCFSIAYAIGLLLTGKLLDRFGTKISYALAIVIWSIAGMGHALARGVVSFAIARFFLGFAESANFPSAIKSVAEWFPKKERALATSLFNSGTNVGALLAPIIVSGITVLYGWQWAFIILGSLGFIWLFFWIPVYKLPEKHPKVSETELAYINSDVDEEPDRKIAWKSLFKYKETLAICLAKFFVDWVWWFYLFWAPDFLNTTQGVDIKQVVLPLIIIYTIASVGGIAGGSLSSFLIKKGKSIDFSRKIAMLICAIGVLPIVFAASASSFWPVVLFISLGTAMHQGFSTNLFTIISDIFPKSVVGSMVGLVGFVGALGGAISASLIGLLLQLTHSYFFVFLTAGSMYILAWVAIKLLIPKIKPLSIL
jgi:ACS family hexuronate transporter-like MFS transporter